MCRPAFVFTFHALSAAAALGFIMGCSGGSTAVPKPVSPQNTERSHFGRIPGVVDPYGLLNIDTPEVRHFKSFYACPAKGPIKYLADDRYSVIDVFAGKFAGQAPCGQVGAYYPVDIFVDARTHDLYVTNLGSYNITVFHRGQTTPYITYTDPSVQSPWDVTVAKDGTVIASNILQAHGPEDGSISTWSGGKFIGNFPMTHDVYGGFVTVSNDGTVYFDDAINGGGAALWSMKCPAGVCGIQTRVKGVTFEGTASLAVDSTGDLLASDAPGTAKTFELPNPIPSTFSLQGRLPDAMAINQTDHHWFIADAANLVGAEFDSPNGKFVGTVSCGQSFCAPTGIAVDP